MSESRNVDVADIARALLDSATKCYACDEAATRTAYGPLVDAPRSYRITVSGPKPHEPMFEHHYPNAGCAAPYWLGAPAVAPMPSRGRWKWRCCDAHEPQQELTDRIYEDRLAPELRLARTIVSDARIAAFDRLPKRERAGGHLV